MLNEMMCLLMSLEVFSGSPGYFLVHRSGTYFFTTYFSLTRCEAYFARVRWKIYLQFIAKYVTLVWMSTNYYFAIVAIRVSTRIVWSQDLIRYQLAIGFVIIVLCHLYHLCQLHRHPLHCWRISPMLIHLNLLRQVCKTKKKNSPSP